MLPQQLLRTALFAGTFDPPHYGHLDIIKRAACICHKLVVCVGINPHKASQLLPTAKRIELLQIMAQDVENVLIASHEGLVATYALEKDIDFLIRGLRNAQDFEIEANYFSANWALAHKDTILLPCKPEYQHISSTLIREIHAFKGNLAAFVPSIVIESLS